jgi:hypothetical protein
MPDKKEQEIGTNQESSNIGLDGTVSALEAPEFAAA